MTTTPPSSRSKEGAFLWLIKIIAGLLIVILLGLHYVVNHLIAPEGLLSYADVVRYYQNPVIPTIEIAFLIFAVSHSLIGVRSILLDLNPSQKWMRVINPLLVGLGVAAVTYGVWLALTIAGRGS